MFNNISELQQVYKTKQKTYDKAYLYENI